jgi:hypothetical protein
LVEKLRNSELEHSFEFGIELKMISEIKLPFQSKNIFSVEGKSFKVNPFFPLLSVPEELGI